MPRKPRKPTGRKKGYRRFIGFIRKGKRQYKQSTTPVQSSNSNEDTQVASSSMQEEAVPLSLSSSVDVNIDPYGFRGFDVPPLQQPVRCLSLFDGISTGLVALDRLGILVSEYFSSEIDQDAIAIQKKRFPLRVTQVGCVTKINEKQLNEMGPINLLIGGSPCEDLSRVNPRRRGLFGENSTGKLFFEYIRILQYLQKSAKMRNKTLFYLYENTANMNACTKQTMIKYFEAGPIVLCASSFVPMCRKRLFFSNLPKSTEDLRLNSEVPPLQDFLDVGKEAAISVVPTITTNSNSHKKKNQFPVIHEGEEMLLSVNELEKLFGLVEGYTDNGFLSTTRRQKLIGKSWCVPVIAHLLKPLQHLNV